MHPCFRPLGVALNETREQLLDAFLLAEEDLECVRFDVDDSLYEQLVSSFLAGADPSLEDVSISHKFPDV